MATYTTLEEIKASIQTNLFADDLIELRPEQRDAIDRAKERFCSKSGKKPDYEFTILSEYRKFLWNAKMRFGKTICAMQLTREMGAKRTLIVTHRPVVGESWLGAFRQVFGTKTDAPLVKGNSDMHTAYAFGTRSDTDHEGNFYDLEKFVETEGNHYVFFVSMQYIRLSELVNAKTLAKNQEKEQEDAFGHSATRENEKLKAAILNTDWDLVVIDEAHEGTRTALGERVIKDFLKKEKTKMLHLSGTPFNLYDDFDPEKEVFTWDYISEQLAKLQWEKDHPGVKNPYADLPQMKILTYDVTKNINQILDQTGIFTFSEFFRTWTGNPKEDRAIMPEGKKGRFIHEEEVVKFLDLLCTKDNENNFPFSTDEYRRIFRHTLWVVPPLISIAKALETLLNEHPIFRRFNIKNVAGNVDTDEQKETALDAVKNAIGDMPERTSTITISCGRLTTGVTVEPWTAVFYLKGGDNASTYMQTIFRVQSPYKTADGKMKKTCYVFDFSPDRTLKVVAETAKFSSLTKIDEAKKAEGEEEKTQEMRDKETLKKFVELCPLINMAGGQMAPLEVAEIYKKLENVFIDRLVRKGFDDPCLYNQAELNNISPDIINHIGEHGGKAPDETRQTASKVVDLSHMTPEQRAAWEAMIAKKKAEAAELAAKKAKKDEEFKAKWEAMTDEEREQWLQEEAEKAARREKAKEEREEFKKRITNIRGIALRIPLLMYGGADAGDTKEDLTVENFTRKIKDESWDEFMPKGISKADFNKIRHCFNATRFEEAGKKYRALTREADFMHVEERIKQITEIFSYFHNPDKETVLTPWRVVNMHMSDTLGGWCFYNETFDNEKGQIDKPRFVEQSDYTDEVFGKIVEEKGLENHILEINSKTGLYPLYVAYTMYRYLLKYYAEYDLAHPNDKETLLDKSIDKEELLVDPINKLSILEEQAIWDDVVSNNLFVICNTPMAVGITRRTLLGFRKTKKENIKAERLIERATNDKEGLVDAIKSIGFWKGNSSKKEMEFKAAVGNPPYMIKKEDTSDTAIYHTFMELGYRVSPIATFITPGRFLFNAGKTPEEFNKRMLNDEHFRVIWYEPDSQKIFENVDVKGGITVTLRDEKRDFGPIRTFTAHYELSTILPKVVNRPDFKPIDKMIVLQNKFNLKALYAEHPEYQTKIGSSGREKRLTTSIFNALDVFTLERVNDDDISILGLIDNVRHNRFIPKRFIEDNANLDKYKVIIPKSNGSGALGEALSTPLIGEPLFGYTQSFIGIGAFKTIYEAEAALKYVKTKFLRTMLGILKVTQDNNTDVWAYVPQQDFTPTSDIDWKKSVADIDQQLFVKYGFGFDEIAFIDEHVIPME